MKKPLTPKQLAEAYRAVFTTGSGPAVLANLRAGCRPPDYAQPRDGIALALHAAFLDGQREFIRRIEHMIQQAESDTAPAQEAETE